MQDPTGAFPLRSIGGGCSSRIFGDGRFRSQPGHVLKCPRCDSLNTKFCYYNNYNLSQPRHFCRNCRRYWTKGGVLRNIPAGGGCRKTKRSKTKKSAEDKPSKESIYTGKTSSRSSSESSSLTAGDPSSSTSNPPVRPIPATSPLTPPQPPLPPPPAASVSLVDQIMTLPDSRLFHNSVANHNTGVMKPSVIMDVSPEGINSVSCFKEDYSNFMAGNIAGTLSSTAAEIVGLNFPGFPFKFHHQKIHELTPPTEISPAVDDLMSVHGRMTSLDWPSNGEPPPGLFDLPSAIDPNYWSQNQWTDHDEHHHLFLP